MRGLLYKINLVTTFLMRFKHEPLTFRMIYGNRIPHLDISKLLLYRIVLYHVTNTYIVCN